MFELKDLVKLALILCSAVFLGCEGGQPSEDPEPLPPPPAEDDTQETKTPVSVSSILMPTDSVYGENGQIEFQLTYPQNITVSGTPRMVLSLDTGNVYANYLSGSGTQNLIFRYTVVSGDADADGIVISPGLDLNGGGLSAGEEYEVQLDLSSKLGSAAGILIDTSTLPPDAVAHLQTAPTTSSSELAVSWSVPADNGTPITHYVLQYRVQGQSTWQTRSPHPTSNSTLLSGLQANTVYELRVAASNGVLGPYSNIQTAEIFDIMGFDPIAWLDAADPLGDGTRPGDGSLVSLWVDKTGAADDATEADPARQPVYEHGVQNQLPAVRFDDLDRGLQGGFTRTNGTNLTIFIVGQYDSAYSDRCMFEFIGPGGARAFFIDRRYAGNTTYNPALTKGQFNLWRIENTGNVSSVIENTLTTLYSGSNDFNTDFTGAGTYYLGDDSTGGNRMFGYIGEILIFDSALSAADIQKIEEYLQTKWGL